MAKTQEELNTIKQEYETLTTKLQELTEDELEQVTGGESVNVNEALAVTPSSKTL